MVQVLVASWLGSTNLGDELLFRSLRDRLQSLGASVVAISTDPAATEHVHQVQTVHDRDLKGIRRAARAADLMVFGGGGLLQDETSLVNVPYHLTRIGLARSVGTPVVAVGLGVGALETRTGRRLVRRTFRPTPGIPTTVRDAASQDLLATLGVPSTLACDLAVSLAGLAQPVTPDRAVAVCLRPWSNTGRLPVAGSWERGLDPTFTERVARHLDQVIAEHDVSVRFVPFQAGRDDRVHAMVAAAMEHRDRTEEVLPTMDTIAAIFGSTLGVVSMRYHGGLLAAVAARPSVLIGYSGKVGALCHDLAGGARLIDTDQASTHLGEVERIPLTSLGKEVGAMIVDHAARSAQTVEAMVHLRKRDAATQHLLARAIGA